MSIDQRVRDASRARSFSEPVILLDWSVSSIRSEWLSCWPGRESLLRLVQLRSSAFFVHGDLVGHSALGHEIRYLYPAVDSRGQTIDFCSRPNATARPDTLDGKRVCDSEGSATRPCYSADTGGRSGARGVGSQSPAASSTEMGCRELRRGRSDFPDRLLRPEKRRNLDRSGLVAELRRFATKSILAPSSPTTSAVRRAISALTGWISSVRSIAMPPVERFAVSRR
jgi:hypothetical protein